MAFCWGVEPLEAAIGQFSQGKKLGESYDNQLRPALQTFTEALNIAAIATLVPLHSVKNYVESGLDPLRT